MPSGEHGKLSTPLQNMNDTFRSRLTWGLAAAFAPAMLLTSCKQETAPKAVAPPEVLVLPAGTRDVPVYREWIGTLDGSENAEIRARVTGYLQKRDYDEGSLVKKGDLLFEIDQRPFEAALAEAKSQLEQGKAVQLASQAEADRSKELYDKKVIAEKEFINKTQMNESNSAKVSALQANLEQAQINLAFCRITSPVDGVAGIAQAQIGDLVGTAGSQPLTTVSTLDPMKIIFPISEAEYLTAAEKTQQSLQKALEQREDFIELILADGKTFPNKARLLSVDRQVKATTGTILVTAVFKNPGSVLRPGQYARARIMAKTLTGAVVVPQRAVAEVQGAYSVAVVVDGKAEIRPVQTGPRTGTDWVITSGLKPGETVIVEGGQKVKAGMPVSAKPWTPAPEAAPGAGLAQQKPAEAKSAEKAETH